MTELIWTACVVLAVLALFFRDWAGEAGVVIMAMQVVNVFVLAP